MKKKLLPLAIAAAMAAPGLAAAADTSGYGDIIYTATDDYSKYGPDGQKDTADDLSKSATTGKFGASGEVDFSGSPADGVTVRMDVDLSAATYAAASSVNLEQVNFAWGATEGVTVIGGIFNNPIGMESQADAPDMWGTNAGVVHNILDNQTALYDNNVAGLAVAGAVGPVTLTGAYLNDLYQSNEQNSIALVANASPIAGLDLELGYVSQASQADSAHGATDAENVIDFNVAYAIPGVAGLSVALDYLSPSKVIDSAYELKIDYKNGPYGAGLRTESVSWSASGSQDSTRDTFHVSYAAASNLTAILEIASGDDKNPMTTVTGIQPDNLTTLELIATF